MTRTFWLSFVDPDAPEGQRSQGVCVVDVTEEEVAAMTPEIDTLFPQRREGAEWIAVAMRKTWYLGCNPGGEVAFAEIPSTRPVPRNRLLVGDELAQWVETKVH